MEKRTGKNIFCCLPKPWMTPLPEDMHQKVARGAADSDEIDNPATAKLSIKENEMTQHSTVGASVDEEHV
eukprot:scaffold226658_cov40-Prasinocladus_malaysianus.AAC.1